MFPNFNLGPNRSLYIIDSAITLCSYFGNKSDNFSSLQRSEPLHFKQKR